VLNELASVQEPRLVQVHDQENPLVALANGQPPLVVENWMYANSIHIIDYLRIFCRGSVENVENVVKWSPLDPRFVVAKVTFSSGDIGIYQAVWNAPGPWSVAVNTQSKRWEMRPLEQACVQTYKDRRSETIPTHEWDTKFKPGIRLQAEEVVRAVRGESHHLPSLEDGLATMKLVQQIYA
jgi:predicted dehydrogenase